MRDAARLLTLLFLMAGCASTVGQIEMLYTNQYGDLVNTQPRAHTISITKGDVFSLTLDSLFLRHLREVGPEGELFVFMEIYDEEPTDDSVPRILFETTSQPRNSLLNVRDRLAFGPIVYSGRLLRGRLIAVELDGEDNEKAKAVLHTAIAAAAAAYPAAAAAAPVARAAGDTLIALNKDDREFVFEFTLYPSTSSKRPHLQTGTYVLLKTESARRGWRDETRTMEDTVVGRAAEDYAGLFYYTENENPLAQCKPVTPLTVLNVENSQLFLQIVALEDDQNGVLMAAERLGPLTPAPVRPLPPGYSTLKLGGRDHEELRFPRTDKRCRGEDEDVENHIFRMGARHQYDEKSYALLTVSRGGDPVERSLLEELGKANRQRIGDTLQKPMDAARLAAQLKDLEHELVKLASRRDVTKKVNEQVPSDKERTKGSFPVAFLQELGLPGADSKPRNEAIVEIVRSLASGFPYGIADAGVDAKIKEMRALKDNQFCPKPDGKFQFQKGGCPSAAGPVAPDHP